MIDNTQPQANPLPLKQPSHRMERVNSNIKQAFGDILQQEAELLPDTLVTVSDVDTKKNLSSCVIWLSVFPLEKAKATLKKLRPQMYHLQGLLNRELHMRTLPRINLQIDYGAEHADKIERKLADLDKE